MTDIGQRVVRDLRDRLFRHILDQSATFFSRRTTGQLMSRITNDVEPGPAGGVGDDWRSAARSRCRSSASPRYLFYVDARLALVCHHRRAARRLSAGHASAQRSAARRARSQEELEQLSHVTAEAFTGHRIVKAFGAEAHEEQRFRRASHRLYRTNMKVTRALAILPPLMELLGGVAVVGADLVRQHADRGRVG